MSGHVAHIWRHPIKSHGRQELAQIALEAGRTMPWDRTWAVALEGSKANGSEWVPCGNFSRGSKSPALMAINATLDEETGVVTLSHPDQDDIQVDPEDDNKEFLKWVAPLVSPEQPVPARIIRVESRGMTDTDYPSISLNNLASHREVSSKMGTDLSPLCWRGNLVLDGLEPWAEFDWVGKSVRIGSVELTVKERIVRCTATMANPETGVRDADTLDTLRTQWGHQDFGVYAEVVKSGQVNVGDKIEVAQ